MLQEQREMNGKSPEENESISVFRHDGQIYKRRKKDEILFFSL